MPSENVHVLLFHRVSPVRDPLWDPMDPVLFREVIAYVNRKFTVLSLEEYFYKERRKLKLPPAIITFDDGYHDFIEYSFPILQEYKMPATMFVVTECIDQNKPTWTYQLDHLFFHTAHLKTDQAPDITGFKTVASWSSKAERLQYGSRLKQHLKKVSPEQRLAVLEFYAAAFNDIQQEGNTMLSWDELKFLNKNNIEVGSHTVTHPPLATIEDDRIIEREMIDSGMKIREHLGVFPASISYPVGSYNNKVKNIAHRTGYKMGLAVDQRIYNEEKHGRFSIPRLELYNESFFKTKLRINGTLSRLKSIAGR
jgi:peptidoglycan/xylan/chitin deacetylase (PgdA/CDA1 family)